jgi:hypothetical protein
MSPSSPPRNSPDAKPPTSPWTADTGDDRGLYVLALLLTILQRTRSMPMVCLTVCSPQTRAPTYYAPSTHTSRSSRQTQALACGTSPQICPRRPCGIALARWPCRIALPVWQQRFEILQKARSSAKRSVASMGPADSASCSQNHAPVYPPDGYLEYCSEPNSVASPKGELVRESVPIFLTKRQAFAALTALAPEAPAPAVQYIQRGGFQRDRLQCYAISLIQCIFSTPDLLQPVLEHALPSCASLILNRCEGCRFMAVVRPCKEPGKRVPGMHYRPCLPHGGPYALQGW